jgi:hypothetical protein
LTTFQVLAVSRQRLPRASFSDVRGVARARKALPKGLASSIGSGTTSTRWTVLFTPSRSKSSLMLKKC